VRGVMMGGKMKGRIGGQIIRWISFSLCLGLIGCGGSLYKVKPKIDAPVTNGRESSAAGLTVRAVPLLADEESQDLFEANLPLAGLLPIRLEISNAGGTPLSFERVRISLRDGDGRQWKLRSPKQTVSRILTDNAIYLYNPNARRNFEAAVAEHGFDLKSPLDAGNQRRGLLFFQTPKKEAIDNPRGLVLTIEGLPQAIEIIFN
jgi:hypothetical protein